MKEENTKKKSTKTTSPKTKTTPSKSTNETKKKNTQNTTKTTTAASKRSSSKKVSNASTKNKTTKTANDTATKKTSTKKTNAKNTTSKKTSTTVKKTTTKKSSDKVAESAVKTTKKKVTKTTSEKKTPPKKLEKENVEIKSLEPKVEELEEVKDNKPFIEIKKEYVDEATTEFVVTNIKQNDELEVKTPNYKVIIILLILIIVLFICGVVYILDYSKKVGDNKDNTSKENISYKLEDLDEKLEEDSKKEPEEVVYENIEKITIKEYEKKAKNKEKMILLVASKYCGHCAVYEPILNAALKEKELKAYKIDVAEFKTEEERELFDSLLQIKGTPTTFIIENGKSVASITSSTTKENVLKWIEDNYIA